MCFDSFYARNNSVFLLLNNIEHSFCKMEDAGNICAPSSTLFSYRGIFTLAIKKRFIFKTKIKGVDSFFSGRDI